MFERTCNAAMKRFALSGEQPGIDGLAGERVPEGEVIRRFLHHQLRCNRLAEVLHQPRSSTVQQVLEYRHVETVPHYCCHCEQLPGSLTQAPGAL